MQDDVSDGVKWLVDQGIADPKRIGIYGASYGGYATLAGVTFTPDLYAAAVNYVGVSNLFTFMKTIPPYWEPFRAQMYEMVGNPDDAKDQARMKATSPVFHADRIRTPLFVAQGARDPRVNKAESDQIVEPPSRSRAWPCSTWSRTTKATALPTKKISSSSTARWKPFCASTCALDLTAA
jgi:dipeptidyl aminopeptidase/acylaminoacyl peptidase